MKTVIPIKLELSQVEALGKLGNKSAASIHANFMNFAKYLRAEVKEVYNTVLSVNGWTSGPEFEIAKLDRIDKMFLKFEDKAAMVAFNNIILYKINEEEYQRLKDAVKWFKENIDNTAHKSYDTLEEFTKVLKVKQEILIESFKKLIFHFRDINVEYDLDNWMPTTTIKGEH